MKIGCTPKEAADKNVFVFPTKGYDEILFFQSKQEMLKSAAAQIAYKKKTAPPDCNSRGAV